MNDHFITVRDLTLEYGSQRVLENLNFECRRGEVLGVLGRIGAGKTRILRLLAGLEKPTSGEIRWAAGQHSVGYVFQEDRLLPWLTVEDNLHLCQQSEASSFDEVVSAFQLGKYLKKKPPQISGGMRQKVNLARGFINRPPLVLLDEPFSALDPLQKRDLQKSFLDLQMRDRPSAVFVTHEVRDALLLCDRVALLSKKIQLILDNPYKGRFDEDRLFAEEGYRALHRQIMDFYEKGSV